MKAVQVEIRRLDDRINSQKAEIVAEIRRLDEKIDNVDQKIDTAIQIRERLAALEAKFAAMER